MFGGIPGGGPPRPIIPITKSLESKPDNNNFLVSIYLVELVAFLGACQEAFQVWEASLVVHLVLK
jgi:hypothetical protein